MRHRSNPTSEITARPHLLERCANHAVAYLHSLKTARVAAKYGADELRSQLNGPLPRLGRNPTEVLDHLVRCTEYGHNRSAGGRFFAWVIGGTVESAIAADWMTTVWDENAAMFSCATAAAVVEEVVGDWLKALFDLPSEASFALTSGCQMAHFTCLAAARQSLCEALDWDVSRQGLRSAPQIRVLASETRHSSVDRAVRFLGIGEDNIVTVPVDDDHCMSFAHIRSHLESTDQPTIVVLGAADLNAGAFDAFSRIIPLAKNAGAWTHVDGDFGLVSRASATKRALSAGLELADSWATDGHKWLNVAFDSGLAFVRHRDAHRKAMTVAARYLDPAIRVRDAIDWTPEWSRRARGYPLYAALMELGADGVASVVDNCCECAAAIVDGIDELPNTDVVWRPTLNQGLVRFLDPRPGAKETQHDKRTQEVIDAVNASGEAFFGGTDFRGRRAMRVSVVNWRTDADDVRRTLQAIEGALSLFTA